MLSSKLEWDTQIKRGALANVLSAVRERKSLRENVPFYLLPPPLALPLDGGEQEDRTHGSVCFHLWKLSHPLHLFNLVLISLCSQSLLPLHLHLRIQQRSHLTIPIPTKQQHINSFHSTFLTCR
ncbi:hypothetical protein PIB30_073849 [Stylosanthes scabra]|uniref:Uncharacterized protein n=1 Tax=Stylosanthes scabra TaxID=79078 RepID=A0ABU6XMX3_9FABA|nr:hypothetical protein [Stylosanthes scabra]